MPKMKALSVTQRREAAERGPVPRWASRHSASSDLSGRCSWCGGTGTHTNLRGGSECAGCGAPRNVTDNFRMENTLFAPRAQTLEQTSLDPYERRRWGRELSARVDRGELSAENAAALALGRYTVQPGDSWSIIAGKLYGDCRMGPELADANWGIEMLRPGVEIVVPSDFYVWKTTEMLIEDALEQARSLRKAHAS